jgi:hypothetical protein
VAIRTMWATRIQGSFLFARAALTSLSLRTSTQLVASFRERGSRNDQFDHMTSPFKVM